MTAAESKVASEPEALVGFFRALGCGLTRIGLEAGPLAMAICRFGDGRRFSRRGT
jgi:hypothetical protein